MSDPWFSGYSYLELAFAGLAIGVVVLFVSIALIVLIVSAYQVRRGPRKPEPRKNFRPF